MYEYASKIIPSKCSESKWLQRNDKWIRISLNPSSWFANQFRLYNETYEKYHFQVTAGVQSVMERVRDYMDDIGFVYILSQQKKFLYELSKQMHFELSETDVMLYPGG